MPSMEDVKATLEKLDGGQELYDVIVRRINSAMNDRKNEIETLRAQLAKSETLVPFVKELGYDPEKPNPDLFKTIKAQLEKSKESGERLTGTQKELSEMRAAHAELDRKFSDSQKALEAEKTARKNAIAKDLLLAKLNGKIYGANAHANDLISSGNVSLGPDEKSLVWKDNNDPEKALLSFFDVNKSDLVNTQTGGPGKGNVSGNHQNVKQMARSEFEKLNPAAQAEFLKSTNYSPSSLRD